MNDSINFMVHPLIKNKPERWDPAYASSWEPRNGSLADLQNHVSAGGAFIGCSMQSDHRTSSAFSHSNLLVVDIDHGLTVEEFLKHPLAEQAAWVYTTASHKPDAHRFRVVFQVEKHIANPEIYKQVITLLIKALGGDKACSDACRLYYGNDQATHPLWQPKTCINKTIISDAELLAIQEAQAFNAKGADFDPDDIERAIFCLEQVIEPTKDNNDERATKFLPITQACSRVGAALFPAWQDWALRGYHGRKNNQGSERYYQRAYSNTHTLGTIFYHAGQDNPDWRDELPEGLKSSNGYGHDSVWTRLHVSGYEFEDFVEDDFGEGLAFDKFAAIAQEAEDRGTWVQEFAKDMPDDSDYPDHLFEDGAKPWRLPEEPDFDDDEVDPDSVPTNKGKKDPKELPENLAINAVKTTFPQLRYNTTSGVYEYGSIHNPEKLTQDQMEHAYMKVNPQAGISIPKAMIKDSIVMLAEENKYSPVVRYLNSCAANAKPVDYFHRIGSELLGLPDEGVNNPRLETGQLLHDAIMQRFFVGAIARALNPGCTHDWMPILVGNQACGKSSFLQYITPPNPDTNQYEWSCLIQQDIGTLANRPHKLHAGWIVVLDECERYFGRRHVEQLKNLVSTPVDRSALKYRNEMNFPRTFVLAGACNSTDFLSDPTGNRRFMPVIVEGKIRGKRGVKVIDLDKVKRDRDGIWAAAYKSYLDNPVHLFDSSELAEVQDYVNSFEQENPLDRKIMNLVKSKISGTRIVKRTGKQEPYWRTADLMEWMEIPATQQNSMVQHTTDSLKRLGFKRVQYRCDGPKNPPTSIWIKRDVEHYMFDESAIADRHFTTT